MGQAAAVKVDDCVVVAGMSRDRCSRGESGDDELCNAHTHVVVGGEERRQGTAKSSNVNERATRPNRLCIRLGFQKLKQHSWRLERTTEYTQIILACHPAEYNMPGACAWPRLIARHFRSVVVGKLALTSQLGALQVRKATFAHFVFLSFLVSFIRSTSVLLGLQMNDVWF